MHQVKCGVSLHYFYLRNTKTIYLFLKAAHCPNGSIFPSAGKLIAVNACAKDMSRLQSQTLTMPFPFASCCRLSGAKLTPQLIKLDLRASQCFG